MNIYSQPIRELELRIQNTVNENEKHRLYEELNRLRKMEYEDQFVVNEDGYEY